jgi:hypothetical protein
MEMDLAHFTEKDVLDWNLQGARRRGRPRKTWGTTIEDIITDGKDLERG